MVVTMKAIQRAAKRGLDKMGDYAVGILLFAMGLLIERAAKRLSAKGEPNARAEGAAAQSRRRQELEEGGAG